MTAAEYVDWSRGKRVTGGRFKAVGGLPARGIRLVYCQGCSRLIPTGGDFVMAGKYPSFSTKLFAPDMLGIDVFGPCYHKGCYDLVVLVTGEWGTNP